MEAARALPIILDRVQAAGELRTAKQNADTVITMQTHKEPTGWVAATPVATLYRSATQNQALVAMTGTVEAGVDLRQANISWKMEPTGRKLVVSLPHATIYEPTVDGRVHHAQSGLFWKDSNIALKAAREAKRKFRSAAQQKGLAKEAEKNAEILIKDLIVPLHDGPIEVQFTNNPVRMD